MTRAQFPGYHIVTDIHGVGMSPRAIEGFAFGGTSTTGLEGHDEHCCRDECNQSGDGAGAPIDLASTGWPLHATSGTTRSALRGVGDVLCGPCDAPGGALGALGGFDENLWEGLEGVLHVLIVR